MSVTFPTPQDQGPGLKTLKDQSVSSNWCCYQEVNMKALMRVSTLHFCCFDQLVRDQSKQTPWNASSSDYLLLLMACWCCCSRCDSETETRNLPAASNQWSFHQLVWFRAADISEVQLQTCTWFYMKVSGHRPHHPRAPWILQYFLSLNLGVDVGVLQEVIIKIIIERFRKVLCLCFLCVNNSLQCMCQQVQCHLSIWEKESNKLLFSAPNVSVYKSCDSKLTQPTPWLVVMTFSVPEMEWGRLANTNRVTKGISFPAKC